MTKVLNVSWRVFLVIGIMLSLQVFSAPQALASEDTFYAIADVTIYESMPAFSNGSDTSLVVSEDEWPYNTEFLIKFDLSTLSGVTVNWVKLRLYCFDYTGSPWPEIYEVTSYWSESGVTWNTKPSEAPDDMGDDWIGSTGWFETYSEDFGTYELARVVQQWIDNPSSNYGLLFNIDYEGEEAWFRSREYSGTSYDPHLIINYSDANTAPLAPELSSPSDGEVITDLTPFLNWTSFQHGGDGDTQSGYQVRVRDDDNSDAIVYDTGFYSSTSGSSHTYSPGSYSGYDPIADVIRVSESLQECRHYHWHARFRDSSGDWGEWGGDTIPTHWDFWIADINDPTTPGTPYMYSSSDTGKFDYDRITRNKRPTFGWDASSDSGCGLAGYRVSYTDATPDGDDYSTIINSWTPDHDIPEGSHTLYVCAYDTVGNPSSVSSVNFEIDTEAPNPPIFVSPSEWENVNDTTPTLDWQSVSGVWKYQARVREHDFPYGGEQISGELTPSQWTVPSALDYEAWGWQVKVWDIAGNEGDYGRNGVGGGWGHFTTSAPLCNPDFEGFPRDCAQAEGCVVTFQNLTEGCTQPYQEMRWDFNGDGVIETIKSGAQVMDPVSWDYSQQGWGPGDYTVCLSVFDGNDFLMTQCQDNCITVGESCPDPGTPSNLSPVNHATGVSTTADLDWSDCTNTESYDVYLGTSSSPPYYDSISSSSYSPSMNSNTQYFWRIVARNDCGGSTAGPVWDFITVEEHGSPAAYVSFVQANRADAQGENHVTISPEAFVRGRHDRFSSGSEYDQSNSCLKYTREGLWAQITVTNPTNEAQSGQLQTQIRYPDGKPPHDIEILGRTGWWMTIPPYSSDIINIPVAPNQGDPIEDGEYEVFSRFNEEWDYTVPDITVEVVSSELASPDVDVLGHIVPFGWAEYEYPPTNIDKWNGWTAFANTVCSIFSIPIQIPYGQQFPTDFHAQERPALADAARADIDVVSTDHNHTSVRTVWKNQYVHYIYVHPTDPRIEQVVADYIQFDRVMCMVDVLVPSSASFATIENVELMSNVRTHEDDAGKHTVAIWWKDHVDKQIELNEEGEKIEKIIEIGHQTDIEVTFAASLQMGPYRGQPGVDSDGGIIDYAAWHTEPSEVYWLIISADMDSVDSAGTGIQDIQADNLIVGQEGQVQVHVVAPSDGNYYVKILNDNLLPPDWNWTNTESTPRALEAGKAGTFFFNVVPDSTSESFEFWFFRQTWVPGIFRVKDKVQHTLQAAHTPTPLIIQALCPVDLSVEDPDGMSIDKQSSQIAGATYVEMDINDDGELDDVVTIPNPKDGDYQITVIQEPGASPEDTYSLEVETRGQTTVLADDVQISDIPTEPYVMESIPPTPLETHAWTFYTAGFFPNHLPDAYNGQVVLGDLDLADIPSQVQGVWWYDPAIMDYRFWVPGVGGDLMTLTGQFYNYKVLVTGACAWEIPLP